MKGTLEKIKYFLKMLSLPRHNVKTLREIDNSEISIQINGIESIIKKFLGIMVHNLVSYVG